jgi:hypothetical protein
MFHAYLQYFSRSTHTTHRRSRCAEPVFSSSSSARSDPSRPLVTQTGSYPTIVCDKIYLMARPHTNTAVATADTVGSPPVLGQFGASGSAQATAEAFFALIFATAPGKVVLSSGSSSQSFDINAGINSIRAPLIPGQGMRATLARSGTTYIDFAPSFTFASECSAGLA